MCVLFDRNGMRRQMNREHNLKKNTHVALLVIVVANVPEIRLSVSHS